MAVVKGAPPVKAHYGFAKPVSALELLFIQ